MQVIKKLREALTYSRVEKVPYAHVKEVALKEFRSIPCHTSQGLALRCRNDESAGDPVVLDTAEELPGSNWLSCESRNFCTLSQDSRIK